jgi:ribonuclease HII
VTKRLYLFDQSWREKGYPLIAGVDEAGRGPWAGPVVAAAVILKPTDQGPRINDSKKIPHDKRRELYDVICGMALAWAVVDVGPDVIDERNILGATFLAMTLALSKLSMVPDFVIVDGHLKIPQVPYRQAAVIKGDGHSASVAAASILAKVTRDRMMEEAHVTYPQYNFAGNKGYGTADHQAALKTHGPCPLHRKSFAPIRELSIPELDLNLPLAPEGVTI